MRPLFVFTALLGASGLLAPLHAAPAPEGFTPLWNEKDLSGWYGWGTADPSALWAMSLEALAEYKRKSLEGGMLDAKGNPKTDHVHAHWRVENGELVNDGKGLYLTTDKDYGDFELWLEYKALPGGDSGVYLRGIPQVQIWDATIGDPRGLGQDKGSGGLWNNSKGAPGKDPLKKMDKPFGEWNSFKITMIGERVTVLFNGETVVDNAVLENFFAKKTPPAPVAAKPGEAPGAAAAVPTGWMRDRAFARGPIQLQTHGSEIRWRNLFIREIPPGEANRRLAERDADGFVRLDNGRDLSGWEGATDNYEVHEGAIRCKTGKGGNLLSTSDYGDMILRFEFQLPKGGNNGIALRTPPGAHPASEGMEIQVIDTDGYNELHPKSPLKPFQTHGSLYYGVGAKQGYLRPLGEWNFEEIELRNQNLRVTLNGTCILDVDFNKLDRSQFAKVPKGLDRALGRIGFAGHSDPVAFRNILVKRLDAQGAQPGPGAAGSREGAAASVSPAQAATGGAAASAISLPEGARESRFFGYRRVDFKVNGRDAWMVFPESAAPGKPWYWRTEFFGHEPQVDLELLRRGFHVGYVNVQNLYGAPVAMEHMDAFYENARSLFGVAGKVALAGFSRGGLFAFNWGALHPERVSAIYGDNPVCDFKSWPGGKGTGKGSKGDWERLLGVYGFASEAEAMAYKFNPVDNLDTLAKARVPVLGFCGRADDVVPVEENIGLLKKRYEAAGAPVFVIERPFTSHHPHSLRDPAALADFLEACARGGLQAVRTGVPGTPYGYNYHALRRGLPNALRAFQSGGSARVAFLGGSITQMKGWRDRVSADLVARFPQTRFEFVDAGIGSLGSTPGAFRLERDVLSSGPVDLLVAESAVNDSANAHTDIEQGRAVEGIVRHFLNANPKGDALLLYFVDPEKMADVRKGLRPAVIRNQEKVAAHYGLPSLDLAEEVTERIAAGEFTWDKDFKNLHPAPFGHEVYFKAISRLLDAAVTPQKAPHPGQGPGPRELPAPLDKACYENGRLVPPSAAVPGAGWELVQAWKPEGKEGVRPGFVNVPMLVGATPGATAKLDFEGTAVGLFVVSGLDAGRVEYRIDGGDWQKRELFTQWSSKLHLPWAVVLSAGLPAGRHTLEFRPSAEHDAASAGTAIRVAHFLVN